MKNGNIIFLYREMITFIVYKYYYKRVRKLQRLEFSEENDDLTNPNNRKNAMSTFEEVLDRLLTTKSMNITEVKYRKVEIHENRICKRPCGIAIMDVCNRKNKFVWQEYQKVGVEDEPYCRVIIDNRPDYGYFYVEDSTIFGKHGTDKLVKLLMSNLNTKLNEYGWEMEVFAKLPENTLWDVVNERKNKGEFVKSVKFELPNPQRMACNNLHLSLSERTKQVVYLSECFNAYKTIFHPQASKGENIPFDRMNQDMANLVSLCSVAGYGVTVYFHKGRKYSQSDSAHVRVEIPENEISSFLEGYLSFGDAKKSMFSIENVLNELGQKIKNCQNGCI